MSSVPEKDWKIFRKLQAELTATACELIFAKVAILTESRKSCEHKSYLELYDLIKNEDAKIAEMFNNPTRNNVLLKIVAIRQFGVLSNEQFQMFTSETQERVNSFLELRC
jgi:hypothetical protein